MAKRSRRNRNKQKQTDPTSSPVPAWLMVSLVAGMAFLTGFAVAALIFSSQQPAAPGEELYTAEEVEAMIADRMLRKPYVTDFELTGYTLEGDPALGPEDAKVEIVEYSDFGCGYCGRFYNQTLQPIIEAYGDQVRFVYRDAPVLNSFDAAYAAECANEQGRFWEYHNYLFANQGSFSQDLYMMIANKLGLDLEDFEACLTSDRIKLEVEADYEVARELGVTGTPSFTVNGEFFIGAQPFEYFKEIIDAELAK